MCFSLSTALCEFWSISLQPISGLAVVFEMSYSALCFHVKQHSLCMLGLFKVLVCVRVPTPLICAADIICSAIFSCLVFSW